VNTTPLLSSGKYEVGRQALVAKASSQPDVIGALPPPIAA
jgi:hypothetical protein